MQLNFNSPKVMTIINATPDSFFSGSRTMQTKSAAQRVRQAISEGADLLDVGGYSSRPNADDVSENEEFARVKSVLKTIKEIAPDMPLSLDTFRASVAEKVLEEFGEVIINDISAGELDPRILDVVSNAKVPYIAMHMRGTPSDMQSKCDYTNITQEISEYFDKKLNFLAQKGIDNIIIDPGFGFAKTLSQNYELLAGMDSLKEFGVPILAGISRKSMIYKLLETTPEDALAGTIALNWQALAKGASILRVHDTLPAVQITKMFNYYGSVNQSK